jgi:hypothetical protein
MSNRSRSRKSARSFVSHGLWMALLLSMPVLASPPGYAQEDRLLTTQAEVAQLIAAATKEVMLTAPALRSRVVAEALREAIVVRGVEVYLLVSPAGVEERASYAMSLSLAGAHVGVGSVDTAYLVVDRQLTVTGPLVGELEAVQRVTVTRSSGDLAYTQEVVGWFYRAFSAAQPYELNLSRLQHLEDAP